jgi:hypothetical protein
LIRRGKLEKGNELKMMIAKKAIPLSLGGPEVPSSYGELIDCMPSPL